MEDRRATAPAGPEAAEICIPRLLEIIAGYKLAPQKTPGMRS